MMIHFEHAGATHFAVMAAVGLRLVSWPTLLCRQNLQNLLYPSLSFSIVRNLIRFYGT